MSDHLPERIDWAAATDALRALGVEPDGAGVQYVVLDFTADPCVVVSQLGAARRGRARTRTRFPLTRPSDDTPPTPAPAEDPTDTTEDDS